MPAFRSVASVLVRFVVRSSYELKAGPADGRQHRTSTLLINQGGAAGTRLEFGQAIPNTGYHP
jgi:hypothetical protein